MTIGVPRRTLSLCPECNREAVEAVTRGESSVDDVRERPGIIAAEIIEEAGRILMRKACEKHGPFEDVLSNHPAFFRRMESLGFGGDFNCAGDEAVHNHGVNSTRTGRGTYLIVDLTNRCNMFCSPCYMDANAASYVHELDMQDVTDLFARAKSFKPQREINVLFSGGEATLSPIFLDAVEHAKRVGFHRLHVATNGIRFAQEPDFAVKARAAGLHGVYLQFDGVTDEKNSHRGIGNYMELKLRALDNIAAAGMKTTLQVTVVNGLNNDGIGDIIRFVADHIEKIHGVILQPVMFCGRDEDISADERYAKRYPVSQIAYDLQAQTSFGWEPMRDWFPVSAYGAFAQLCDILHPKAELGSLYNDIHPNHGMFSPILINSQTKEIVPVARFFNVEQFLKDIIEIADSGRRPAIIRSLVSLSLARNFDPDSAPPNFGISQLRDLLADCVYRVAGSGPDWSERAYAYVGVWRLVMVSPMAFQDAYNYDLSLISNSSTPVATQEGEINFCAYNGGRWRTIVEHLHRTASLAEWNRSHGRHPIYAKGKEVDMGSGRVPQRDLVQIDHQHTV
ncbi:MAG TPA: radical SAM protein [Candidatus Sulfotelmatobacter sp.]|nr:radical SAM protein [Candidatus Sulfotelmatobacter sp.]